MAFSLNSRGLASVPAVGPAKPDSYKLRQPLSAPRNSVHLTLPLLTSFAQKPQQQRSSVVVAGRGSSSEPWWDKDTAPNMKMVTSTQELVDALADAGDRLVIVDVYAKWCNACRALYPKLCRLMNEHPDVTLLKVDFDDNRQMCKALNIKVLPYFQLYRGAEGRVDGFSASVSKLQRLKDALDLYDSPFCSLEAMPTLEEFPDVTPHPELHDQPQPQQPLAAASALQAQAGSEQAMGSAMGAALASC